MKHLSRIQSYIRTLSTSRQIHALVLQSPPGFAKSTTIDQALKSLGLEFIAAGSYSTPLHIYNMMCRHSESILVFDDSAGIFEDTKAMSILKAAAWASSGTKGERRVTWGSTSGKVEQESVNFRGKLILITNSIPQSRETKAFLSRSIFYEMNFAKSEIIEMLRSAAKSSEHFEDTKIAKAVAEFLIKKLAKRDHSAISLRTLHIGCELASTHPDDWKELLEPLLPPPELDSVVESLSTGLSPKEQEHRFISETGMSRRTFYNVKKEMGLTRPYRRSTRRKKPSK
jgi:hypothetical protein